MVPASSHGDPLPSRCFTLDVSDFPYTRLHVFGSFTPADVVAMTAAIEEQIYSRNAPYRMRIDTRGIIVPGGDVRRTYADFMTRRAEHTRRFCEGEAYVITSAPIRATLTAIMWMARFEFPNAVFATTEDADRWLRSLPPRG